MKARMMDSLRANLKFYAVIGVVGAIIIIWMAISNSWGPSALAGFLMTAANTYGMLLIVVMLGYVIGCGGGTAMQCFHPFALPAMV